MKPIIEREELERLGESLHQQYVNADPFPHIVIDDFFPAEVLDEVLSVFPGPKDMEFYKYDNPLEKKLAMDQLERLPDPIVRVLQFFNSVPMLKFTEKLTGIPCIIPDPYYRGGGIHQMETGGKLDVHIAPSSTSTKIGKPNTAATSNSGPDTARARNTCSTNACKKSRRCSTVWSFSTPTNAATTACPNRCLSSNVK